MFKFLKKVWSDLGRTIFVGDRYKKNMVGIAIGAALIVVVNLVTGSINLIQKNYWAALSSAVLIAFFSMVFVFIVAFKKRTIALALAAIGVVIIYSYDVIVVTTPLMPLWTILFPWAFSYLVSVRVGVLMSGYYSTFYLVLFYSPLKKVVEGKYIDIMFTQFPILYLANAFLCIFIMVQYHRNTLNQMDYSEQLTEAKATAEHANTAKSEFLASMSHEIRTPINAVLGMNEMILRESLQARNQVSKENRELHDYLTNITNYAGNIDSAGKNLLAIINDILDFSKIESGKMEITEADYKFSSVLNDISNVISFKAKDKGLDFIIEVDKDLPDGLYGDELRIRQIMTNLLGNAVKYTKKGSVTLFVGKEEDTVENGGIIHLVVSVKDTGIGIKEEDLAKLFQKFQRVDLQQNSTVEGSGLGLAITKNLLELMHGTIKVESVYGEGSTFTISLPQRVVSTEPVGDFKMKFEKSVQEAEVYHEAFRAPNAHILIVDDTRMNLTVAVGLLKKTQMIIDTAASGLEAIELTKTIKYDLILMDQRMPGMDGTETMKRIKALENGVNKDTPFICLTADAVSGARSHYLAEGFSDYLTKPIDSKALEKMLIKYLPKEKVHAVSPDEVNETKEKETAPTSDEFAPLRSAGIDPEVGLRFCQNDINLYRSILLDYAQTSDEKIKNIVKYYEAEDWKNYAICVHALKSTSKTIGAAELSEIALHLELAANEGNADYIHAEHDNMLELYKKVVAAIRESNPDGQAPEEDDEALEFSPEEDDVLEFSPDEN